MAAVTNNCVCRTCLSTGRHRSLFDRFDIAINAESTTLIYQIIMECASVKIVKNDHLPTGICEDCICSLKRAYAFKKQCENSDAVFRTEISRQYEPQLYSKCGTTARDPCVISESADCRANSVFTYSDNKRRANDVLVLKCTGRRKKYFNECDLYKHTESKHSAASSTLSANSTDGNEVSCTVSRDNKSKINGIRQENIIKTEKETVIEDAFVSNYRKNNSKPIAKKHSKFRENLNLNAILVKTQTKSAVDKSEKRSFVKNITEKSFACEACGRKFSKPEYVRRHSKVHTGECVCHICKNIFSCSQALNFHVKCHSGEASSFMCDHCGKSYRSNAVLQNHMQRKHMLSGKNKELSYSCQICNKSFGYLRGLQDHSVRHGEKKCLCHVCGKPFVNQKELTKHSRVHSGLKPYECVTCGKTFAQKKNLKVHKLSHTEEKPIHCELCDRSFKLPQNLRDHMRTHTGEKPYMCEICSKSFPYHKSLIVHRKTHRSENSVHS